LKCSPGTVRPELSSPTLDGRKSVFFVFSAIASIFDRFCDFSFVLIILLIFPVFIIIMFKFQKKKRIKDPKFLKMIFVIPL
jgi:hypothetical protein